MIISNLLITLAVASVPGLELPAGCIEADIEYSLLPPGATDEVVYNIHIIEMGADSLGLAPRSYVLDWRAADNSDNHGFSAYIPGHYFSYRPGKFQEAHFPEDSTVMAPGGDPTKGVQCTARYVELLPSNLTGPVVTDNRHETYSANDGVVEINITYNPGQSYEQEVTARYTRLAGIDCRELTVEDIGAMYPDEFSRYRRSSYSLESLRSEPLPKATAPRLDGERWTHRRGEALTGTTVIALLDSEVDGTAAVVTQLRRAVDSLPFATTLILAFTDNDTAAIKDITGGNRHDEIVLVGARSLARDCGATDFPSLLFCRPDATVADIHIGRNNDLGSIVIQKTSMAR